MPVSSATASTSSAQPSAVCRLTLAAGSVESMVWLTPETISPTIATMPRPHMTTKAITMMRTTRRTVRAPSPFIPRIESPNRIVRADPLLAIALSCSGGMAEPNGVEPGVALS
ncbi:hypothetical protein [Aeromicrobium sp.]|uniref:hypothetical protein n=1 Tax=Aeromicrobium sp. TaxID=1871063 RepID=UPI003D6C6BCD